MVSSKSLIESRKILRVSRNLDETLNVTIHTKATQYYSPVVLCSMLYKMVLAVESVNENL